MRVFISYVRGVAPAQQMATIIADSLRPDHAVFVDLGELHGDWAAHVMTELHQANVVIVLLSPTAVHSEVVAAEVAQSGQSNGTLLVPVRLAYDAPFPYPINNWLAHRACLDWQSLADTPRLIAELRQAFVAGEFPVTATVPPVTQTTPHLALPAPIPNAALEFPDGTMDPQSAFYIVRPADALALQTIQRQGVTLTNQSATPDGQEFTVAAGGRSRQAARQTRHVA